MQLYDITIAPNNTRQLDAPGSYFYYYNGSAGGADSTITMRGLSSGLRIVLKPGQAFRLPRGESETSWVLTNFSNTATIVGTVIVGDGDITDNRVTGSVEVVDGGKNRSLSGNAFSAIVTQAAVAGQYQYVQLWNPSGSNKNLIVESVAVSTTIAGECGCFQYNTQLTASVATPACKRNAYASSVGQLKNGSFAAFLISNGFFMDGYLQANLIYEKDFKEPIIIEPGKGLCLATPPSAAVIGSYEYFEESI